MEVRRLMEPLEILKINGAIPHEVRSVASDSRKVVEGALFIAIKGEKADGHKFVRDAKEHGAILFVVQEETGIEPEIVVPDTRIALARIAHEFYERPSEVMKVIGITGTNGKTTTAHLLRAIIGRSLSITTTGYFVNGEELPAYNTTPDPITINSLMRKAIDIGTTNAIIEVSSHACVQRRVDMIDFDAGIFTTLSRDHLDYHRSFEDYREAKAMFFKRLKNDAFAVINHDDPAGEYMIEKTEAKVVTYGITGGNIRGEILSSSESGLEIRIDGLGHNFVVRSSMIGSHNSLNILGAVATSLLMGIEEERIIEGILNFKGVKGRMHPVNCGQPFRVYVDYAHTPDAMAKAISSTREITEGRIIVVFGAGGDRDKGKRPLMGRVASKLADIVIITSDNPRNEPPEDIIEEITLGIESGDYNVIVDRGEAIEHAINIAEKGDTVLILGKGHEEYQEIEGKRIYFSDLSRAKEVLKNHGFECE